MYIVYEVCSCGFSRLRLFFNMGTRHALLVVVSETKRASTGLFPSRLMFICYRKTHNQTISSCWTPVLSKQWWLAVVISKLNLQGPAIFIYNRALQRF